MAILVAINVTLSYTNFNNWLDRNIGRTCRRIYNIHILQYVVYYVHITQSSVNINPCTKWLQEIRSISSFDTGDIRSRILYKKLVWTFINFLTQVTSASFLDKILEHVSGFIILWDLLMYHTLDNCYQYYFALLLNKPICPSWLITNSFKAMNVKPLGTYLK